jgi:hypothetical protein
VAAVPLDFACATRSTTDTTIDTTIDTTTAAFE